MASRLLCGCSATASATVTARRMTPRRSLEHHGDSRWRENRGGARPPVHAVAERRRGGGARAACRGVCGGEPLRALVRSSFMRLRRLPSSRVATRDNQRRHRRGWCHRTASNKAMGLLELAPRSEAASKAAAAADTEKKLPRTRRRPQQRMPAFKAAGVAAMRLRRSELAEGARLLRGRALGADRGSRANQVAVASTGGINPLVHLLAIGSRARRSRPRARSAAWAMSTRRMRPSSRSSSSSCSAARPTEQHKGRESDRRLARSYASRAAIAKRGWRGGLVALLNRLMAASAW